MSEILDQNLKLMNQVKAVKKLVTHIQKQLSLLTIDKTLDEVKREYINMLWIKLYALNTNAHSYQSVLYLINDIIQTIQKSKLNIQIPEQLIKEVLDAIEG